MWRLRSQLLRVIGYLLADVMLAILAASIPRAEGALKTMYEPISTPATQPHLSCDLFHCAQHQRVNARDASESGQREGWGGADHDRVTEGDALC